MDNRCGGLRWEKSAEMACMIYDGRWVKNLLLQKGMCLQRFPRYGLYMWLADERRQILQYDTIAQTLTVPLCRFANLLARAATLCSGLLPKLVENTFVYQNTPAPLPITL